MMNEASLEQVRQRMTKEVHAARSKDDRWLLVHLTRESDGTISLGYDTMFAGFNGSRELRSPRWRTLANAQEFADASYSRMIAGELTAQILFHQLLAGNVPKGVIMHADAVRRWAPQCAEMTPTVNSVRGFLNPKIPENRGRGAKRLGRVTRERLTSNGCYLCSSKLELTLHHIIPREMGGATEKENLLSVCRPCHDAIHRGEIDAKELLMEVSIKRANWLVRSTVSDDDLSGGAVTDL
jgi:5-methylcytosine-specific restriction endonuclease McrA